MALVRSHRVDASAVVANVRVALALVDVDARVAARRQRVAVLAHALERALEVVTLAVVANSRALATFVNVLAKKKFYDLTKLWESTLTYRHSLDW